MDGERSIRYLRITSSHFWRFSPPNTIVHMVFSKFASDDGQSVPLQPASQPTSNCTHAATTHAGKQHSAPGLSPAQLLRLADVFLPLVSPVWLVLSHGEQSMRAHRWAPSEQSKIRLGTNSLCTSGCGSRATAVAHLSLNLHPHPHRSQRHLARIWLFLKKTRNTYAQRKRNGAERRGNENENENEQQAKQAQRGAGDPKQAKSEWGNMRKGGPSALDWAWCLVAARNKLLLP